jgi:hypothetical protein
MKQGSHGLLYQMTTELLPQARCCVRTRRPLRSQSGCHTSEDLGQPGCRATSLGMAWGTSLHLSGLSFPLLSDEGVGCDGLPRIQAFRVGLQGLLRHDVLYRHHSFKRDPDHCVGASAGLCGQKCWMPVLWGGTHAIIACLSSSRQGLHVSALSFPQFVNRHVVGPEIMSSS